MDTTGQSVRATTQLSRLLRGWRERAMLTQEQLAERSGLSVGTVSGLEAGRIRRPRTASQHALANALGLSGDERAALRATARATPGGAAAAIHPDGGPSHFAVPAQLPVDVAWFTGRDAELACLDALLPGQGGARRSVALITAVSGTAGVGKTALAVHWAHRVAGRFPDGQLYVNLRGFDPDRPPMNSAEVLRGFLAALGVPPDRVPADEEARASLYRSRLAGKQVLVVLDNARDAHQVRPLLPGDATAAAVVTSRNPLTPLVAAGAAQPLTIGVMSLHEARGLLARRLGADAVAGEPHAVDRIVAACAGLPLALAIIAARAQQTGFPLAALAAELDEAGRRLDALDAGDPAGCVRTVFDCSYTALTPPAARLFRLLGLHRGPDISAAAAASLGGHPLPEARRWLTELSRGNLLTEHLPGRYSCHDLLRAYAADLAERHDPQAERQAAVTRLLDHYTHTAHAAAQQLHPGREPVALTPPARGTTPERIADHAAALGWLTAERDTLLAAIGQARSAGAHHHTLQLARPLANYLDRQGRWHDIEHSQHAALDAAVRLDDRPGQAEAHRCLAFAHTKLDRHQPAYTHYRHALRLYHALDDTPGQAITLINLGMLLYRQGHYRKALRHVERALALYRAAGHQTGQANALNAIGWLTSQLGDHRQALDTCTQALRIHQQGDERRGEASTWDSLGYIHHQMGNHEQAITCYRHAQRLQQQLGDRAGRATTLQHLAQAYENSGAPDDARRAWHEALHILETLGHPDAATVRDRLATGRTHSPAAAGTGISAP